MSLKKSTTIIEDILAENGTFKAKLTKKTLTTKTTKSESGEETKEHDIEELVVRKQPDDKGKEKLVAKFKSQEAKDLIALFLNLASALVEEVQGLQQEQQLQQRRGDTNNRVPPQKRPPNKVLSNLLSESKAPNEGVVDVSKDGHKNHSQVELVRSLGNRVKRDTDVFSESMSRRKESVDEATATNKSEEGNNTQLKQKRAAENPKELARRLIRSKSNSQS